MSIRFCCSIVRTLSICTIGLLATNASAGETEVWNYDEETDGADISWTSPTAVRSNAATYTATNEITLVEITASVIGFPVTVDVTDQVPPEFLITTATTTGPLPLLLADGTFVAPPPPEPLALSAALQVKLDADGFGRLDASDIVFGSVVVPPGINADIIGFRIAGTVTVAPNGIYGDVNDDGTINVLDVLDVLAAWGNCPAGIPCSADVNGDLTVNVLDLLEVLASWS